MTKNQKNDSKKVAKDIELVDIEDLRSAFGGAGLATKTEKQTGVYAPTRMCSGWI